MFNVQTLLNKYIEISSTKSKNNSHAAHFMFYTLLSQYFNNKVKILFGSEKKDILEKDNRFFCKRDKCNNHKKIDYYIRS